MKEVKLGLHGPKLSEICFGSLAISPLQGRVNLDEAIEIMQYAFHRGVQWIDTAEIYNNYELIAEGIKAFPKTQIVSKSYAVTSAEMRGSIDKARTILNREMIDFFLLHEQESALTLKGHQGAWQELLKAKEDGRVGWIGISTHAVAGVKAGALLPGIDVIHPLLNFQGLGITDGSLQEMLDAISFAAELGIGVYAMKVFGGGHLASQPDVALRFVQQNADVQAMALGMSSIEEVDYNIAILEGMTIRPEIREKVIYRQRKLYIADWCQGCGKCIEACPQGALSLKEIAQVNHDKCILCGYCGRVCSHFCLKIV